MNLQADIVAIAFLGTGIALYFALMRLLGGMLVNTDNSLGASAGKAILAVFPG